MAKLQSWSLAQASSHSLGMTPTHPSCLQTDLDVKTEDATHTGGYEKIYYLYNETFWGDLHRGKLV